MPFISQMTEPKLYNGAEVTSMAMILQHHGYRVTKNELANKINYVPFADQNGLKGHPNDGFVGDMKNGPGLTVYHKPMLQLAKKYVGNRAIDLTGESKETLNKYLTDGLPIWIITTTNLKELPKDKFHKWITKSGTIEITYNVRSVVVTGFDEKYYYVHDPYGSKHLRVDQNDFIKAWEQLGSQAIVIVK